MKYFPVYLLYFISFVDLFAVGLLIPLVANHVRELGASHVVIGLMGSLYSGFQLGSGPIIGSLSDLRGPKRILLASLLVCSAAYMLMGITTSVALLLVLRVLLGIFKQTQMLAKALVPDYERDDLKQSAIYGKMAAISGGGFILGPIIGGHIMEDFAANGFLVNASLSALLFLVNVVALCFLNTPPSHKEQSTVTSSPNFLKQAGYSLKRSVVEMWNIDWSTYWDAFLFKALVGFCMGVYYSSYSVMLKTQFHLTPKHIGYTISFQGIVGSISSYFIAYINSMYRMDHDYTQRNSHCFVLMTTSLVGMGFAGDVWGLVPWLVPLAVANSVARLVTLEMVLKKSLGRHRGTLIGASNSMRSLAGVLAPTFAGAISDYYGVAYALYAATGCSVVGLLLSVYIMRKSRREVQKVD